MFSQVGSPGPQMIHNTLVSEEHPANSSLIRRVMKISLHFRSLMQPVSSQQVAIVLSIRVNHPG